MQTETRTAVEIPSRRWASIKGAAGHYGVAPRTIAQLIEDGYLPAYRLGPKTVRIDLNEADSAVRPYNVEEATVPNSSDAETIAQEHVAAVRALMRGDHIAMAQVINHSKYPHKVHLAAALNVVARLASESPDSERLLDAIGKIVARD